MAEGAGERSCLAHSCREAEQGTAQRGRGRDPVLLQGHTSAASLPQGEVRSSNQLRRPKSKGGDMSGWPGARMKKHPGARRAAGGAIPVQALGSQDGFRMDRSTGDFPEAGRPM